MEPVVKICGLKTVEAAECAIENGADLLGVIMVPNRARTVDDEVLKLISKMVKTKQKISSRQLLQQIRVLESEGAEYFETVKSLILENGPYLVGVFRNQPLETIKEKVEQLQLDFVQLHGSENFEEYIKELDVPVITRYVLDSPKLHDSNLVNRHVLSLLDSELGGEGKLISWDDASEFGQRHGGRYLLAGGLTPENVLEAVRLEGCVGVDVAGGVETDGAKDLVKIKKFIENAKAAYL